MKATENNTQGHASSVEERERAFFADYYRGQPVHPKVDRMRMARELRSLIHCARGKALGRVLSVGCGYGEFERMLAPHVDSLVGIDVSDVAIQQAREASAEPAHRHLDFQCANAVDWQDDKPFDTVICIAFLHHIPETELPTFLRGLMGRLKPGGLFFSQDPNVHGVLRSVGRVLLRGKYDSYHSPDERELSPRVLAHQMRELGLVEVQTTGSDLALIPLGYLLPKAPPWLFRPVLWLDALWCATPLHRWASGFRLSGTRTSV